MKLIRGEKRRVRIDDDFYVYNDATKPVTVKRKAIDIWKGNVGKAGKCMNAHCIIRNRYKFPHPVLGVSVIRSRVFVIDAPGHAVRYFLSKKDSVLIRAHDEKALGMTGNLTLHVPELRKRAGTTHISQHRPHTSKRDGRLRKRLARGERARVLAAVGALQ